MVLPRNGLINVKEYSMSPSMLTLCDDEIRERVLLEIRICEQGGKPWCSSNDLVSRQIDFLIITYAALAEAFGIAPWPDLLFNLGFPGRVLHALFCTVPGMWEAFRRLVARRQSGLPWPTSLCEGKVVLNSVQKRFVYRAFVQIAGVAQVEPRAPIPGALGWEKADFYVKAVTGLAIYVEVPMMAREADADRPFVARHHSRLLEKMRLYEGQGIEPAVIWADEVSSPRALAERLNDIRARLGLPTRPPEPLTWYEKVG